MSYRVVFTPQAEGQLVELYRYLAISASPDIAARYTEAIVMWMMIGFPLSACSTAVGTTNPSCRTIPMTKERVEE
jgi:hypothetical protein